MNSAERLEQQRADAQRRWDSLSKQIAALQGQRDLETRADEKLRLDGQLEDKLAQREGIGRELDQLERRAAEVRGRALLLEAREAERKQSYSHAIACWNEIIALAVPGYDAAAEIERIGQLKARDERRKALLRQLTSRFNEINPIFKSVAEYLQRSDAESSDVEQLLIEQFGRGELDAADFMKRWRQLRTEGAAAVGELDFLYLYQRLERGDMALFLGADLLHQLDTTQPTVQRLAQELAADIKLQASDSSSWPLSAVAEYFQMAPEHGTRALVRGLHARLAAPAESNPLHTLLSRIEAPLLLIAAGHDSQLESAFKRTGKRFVVVSSVISAMGGFHPGQILLRYSDRERPEAPLLGEHLSQLSLLEEGYSILFKLRGTCPSPERTQERDLCSLVLSERSHFDFARALDKILPTYIGAKLGSLGFWFLGFAPEQWEDRLLASAILDGRRSAEPANVVRSIVSQFEAAFWASRGVRRHVFDLAEFVKRLERLGK